MVRADRRYKILIHRFRDIFGIVLFQRHEETGMSLSEAPASGCSRAGRMTEAFVSLVAKHHVEHRDLEFYSLHLGITPKYLSAAIKTESGRTAVEWITSYVILEAKYYLKHTALPIKRIAYELSFVNPMDFYRYFTRHTGISPTEYRNSCEA